VEVLVAYAPLRSRFRCGKYRPCISMFMWVFGRLCLITRMRLLTQCASSCPLRSQLEGSGEDASRWMGGALLSDPRRHRVGRDVVATVAALNLAIGAGMLSNSAVRLLVTSARDA
jgi:hypothetical protein